MYPIAQTSDGFLWFLSLPAISTASTGSGFCPWGLPAEFRFDQQERHRFGQIMNIFADHAGGLWVLGPWDRSPKGSVVTSQFQLEGRNFQSVSEDADGSLWVVRGKRFRTRPFAMLPSGQSSASGRQTEYRFPRSSRYWRTATVVFGWEGGRPCPLAWRHFGDVPRRSSEIQRGHSGSALARGPDGSLWVGIRKGGPGKGLERLKDSVFQTIRDPHVRRQQVASTA